MSDSAEVKLRKRVTALFAMLGTSNINERETARSKLEELLAKHKLTWNDIPRLLLTEVDPASPSDDPDDVAVHPAPLDLIRWLLEKHLYLTEHQFVALALWIVHTFLFQRFSITPRLALVSPVRGCGKTTALDLIKALALKTEKFDHITAAVLFRLVDHDRGTLLLDEVDNQDLPSNSTLRSVINSGHRYDGKIVRFLDGQIVKFSTFAPLALAVIGKAGLPFPVLHRSIVLNMTRDPSAELERFDPKTVETQRQDCETVYRETFVWALHVGLELDPPMPEELRNRPANNWRPLIAIADASGIPKWSKAAREAAIALSKGQDEDLGVLLLADIRGIFERRPAIDRLPSAAIVAELLERPEGLWSEYTGPRGDQAPRRLSMGELAKLLAPFGIRPKSIWPPQRRPGAKSSKGYLRREFETAWASFCDGTPAHSTDNVRYLKRGEQ